MLQWDAEGDLLAVLPRGQGFALVWTAATADVFRVEAGLKVTLQPFLYTCCTALCWQHVFSLPAGLCW